MSSAVQWAMYDQRYADWLANISGPATQMGFGPAPTPPSAPRPFAEGGPVSASEPVLVGERGPELFVPRSAGSIIPNNALGSGVTVNINAAGAFFETPEGQARFASKVGDAVMRVLRTQNARI